MAIQTVVVLNVPGGFRARLAYTVVKPGDVVKFSNHSGQVVTLTFPNGLFDVDQMVLDTSATGSKDTATVQDQPDGRYPYQGAVNGVPVEGESSPEIIIDR